MSIIKQSQGTMTIWDALATPSPQYTKKIPTGSNLTAINPTYQVMRMTEQFGTIGTGWHIGKPEFLMIEAGLDKLVYCTVAVWIDGQQPVYGVGGDFVSRNRGKGAVNDDDAFKKAYTDAVGNALKYYGVAADVHMGRFDDVKYLSEVRLAFGLGADNKPLPTDQQQHPEPKGKARQASPKVNGTDPNRDKMEKMYRSLEAKIAAAQTPEALVAMVEKAVEDGGEKDRFDEMSTYNRTAWEQLMGKVAKKKTDILGERLGA